MADQVINIVFTKNLVEVLSRNPNGLIPIYDSTTGFELSSIRVSELIGGETVKVNWSPSTPYMQFEIVTWNNRLWESKVDNNEGNQPSENTFWTEVSASAANGSALQPWAAGVFNTVNSSVIVNNAGYILNNNVTLPFNSTYFSGELTAGIWLPLGSSITLASEVEAKTNTENTKFLSSLRVFQQWLNNVKTYSISELDTASKFIVSAINEIKALIVFSTDIEADKLSTTKISAIKTFYDWSIAKFATIVSLALKRDKTEIGDAHGFVNPPNTGNFTASNTGASITLNILTNAGASKINGTDYPAANETIVFTADLGQNFIIKQPLGLVKNGFNILDLSFISVATALWDGIRYRISDELHTSKRNLIMHQMEHDTDGARYVMGFASTFGAAATNTFSSSLGTIRDEDRYHSIGSRTLGQIMYRHSSLAYMMMDAPSTAYAKLATLVPQYDNNGVQTPLGNSNYGIMWMYATNCKLPANCEIVFVQGQGVYTSIANAQLATKPSLAGMSVAEWSLLYRVIIRQVANDLVFVQADSFLGASTGPANNGGSPTSINETQVTTASTTNFPFTDQGAKNAAYEALFRRYDSTAWVATDTTLNLPSNTDKDFATGTPVAIITTVTITLTAPPTGFSGHYWFKFKAGTSWGFVWPVGYTAALSGNDAIFAGSIYEVHFLANTYIIRKVA